VSKIQEPIKMNVAAEKVLRVRNLLHLPNGTPAVYVVDYALRELIELLEAKL